MTDVTLTLGDFTFGRFEVPEELSFGGDQSLVVHKLVGGKRIIDSMGDDPAALEWSGIFVGSSALGRARYLDSLRKEGAQHLLTWSEFRYQVVIRTFKADFRAPFRIPYRITCEVLSDDTLPVADPPEYSTTKIVRADSAKAIDKATKIGDTELSGIVSTLDKAIKSVSDFAKATQAEINKVTTPLRAAQDRVRLLIASTTTTLRSASTFGGLLPNNPIAQGANRLANQISASTRAATLGELNGVLGRIGNNVRAAPSGPRRVTVAATDLYALASKEYGNAMAWTTIARANGLTDPMVRDVKTLAVPNTTPDTSGVLNA